MPTSNWTYQFSEKGASSLNEVQQPDSN